MERAENMQVRVCQYFLLTPVMEYSYEDRPLKQSERHKKTYMRRCDAYIINSFVFQMIANMHNLI